MSFLSPSLARAALAPLLAAVCGGCASLDPRPPVLRIDTDTVVATVRTTGGRTLGTTPLRTRLRAREGQTLVLTAPGHDSAVVTLGWQARNVMPTLINPLRWPAVAGIAAYWRHDPGVLDVRLVPTLVVTDAVAALVLAEFADAAEAAGCEPLLVDAWRDAARVLAQSGTPAPPLPDGAHRPVASEVARAGPELRELCARPSPRVDALREIRERLARRDGDAADGAPPLLASVFFGADEWEVRDDTVRARLQALGARLAGTPVTLVLSGYGDAAELPHRELGYQRAMSVIRALRAGGLPADCCVMLSRSGDAGFLAAFGAADPRLNRRVTLSLDYERRQP